MYKLLYRDISVEKLIHPVNAKSIVILDNDYE